MNKTKIKNNKENGFTLIEMIVAVAIFASASVFVLSSLMNILAVQKKVESMRVVSDGFSFGLETMMREIRTGKNYTYTAPATYNDFSFMPAGGTNQLTYALDAVSHTVKRDDGGGAGPKDMTPLSVTVDDLRFVVHSLASNAAKANGLITIIINGHSGSGDTISYFNLQTSVSARNKQQ